MCTQDSVFNVILKTVCWISASGVELPNCENQLDPWTRNPKGRLASDERGTRMNELLVIPQGKSHKRCTSATSGAFGHPCMANQRKWGMLLHNTQDPQHWTSAKERPHPKKPAAFHGIFSVEVANTLPPATADVNLALLVPFGTLFRNRTVLGMASSLRAPDVTLLTGHSLALRESYI